MTKLTFPFTEDKVRALKVGDEVLISGVVFTGRDAVHKYLHEGGELPPGVDLRGGIIYHCGPVMMKQADGTYLAPHLFDFAIVRYDRSGKELARIGTRDPAAAGLNTWPFTAITLPDGGILAGLTNGNRVVEFDRAGTIRWQIDTAETDGAIADACITLSAPGEAPVGIKGTGNPVFVVPGVDQQPHPLDIQAHVGRISGAQRLKCLVVLHSYSQLLPTYVSAAPVPSCPVP